jgi:hypothetical protein
MSRVEGLSSFSVGKDRGVDGAEKLFSASDVRALIPYLSSHNAKGRDVYLTPIDPAHHYIVVDDMTPIAVADFLAAGYRPALIQESSADNCQAIVKVPKIAGGDEQKAANAVVVDLNRRFGDEKFSGVIHPFRMAGFSNKKRIRNNYFTRIVQAAGDLCARAAAALDAARQRFVTDRGPSLSVPRHASQERHVSGVPDGTAAEAFDRARAMSEGLAALRGWTRDESRLDYRAAQIMAKSGFSADDIAAAILARSPDLQTRHKNPVSYASLTAENVSIEEPEGEQTPKASDRPEDPEI